MTPSFIIYDLRPLCQETRLSQGLIIQRVAAVRGIIASRTDGQLAFFTLSKTCRPGDTAAVFAVCQCGFAYLVPHLLSWHLGTCVCLSDRLCERASRVLAVCRVSQGIKISSELKLDSICSASDTAEYEWTTTSTLIPIPAEAASKKDLYIKPDLLYGYVKPGSSQNFTLEAWFTGKCS